jgi:hypothetical protein
VPRPTSQRNRHPLPLRILAAILSALLSAPAFAAQPEYRIGEGTAETNRARNAMIEVMSGGAIHDPNPVDAIPSTPTNNLPCQDSELKLGTVLQSRRNPEADKWGDITVAQPKIWQFERVSALLDGLLRDVEGISLGDLTQLDPSQQNAAALKFIQSALEVGVQYDQAAAVNAANTLNSYNTVNASQTQQLTQYNNYMQTLTSERDRLAAQYSAASNEVNALQALQAAGPLTSAQSSQLADAQSRQASTNASLASVNSLISGAGAAPTLTAPPTVTGTSVQGPASGSSMASSLMGFSDVLKSLPSGVQNNLSTALQSPSYPATKRLDNFITLLYERLAREISVLQDDLTRDPDNMAFLMQFDVGLYPSNKAKDHVARVEFNLDCPGCKVYSLYPGQSSYNLANYSGASKRNTFWGNALTLIGLGVSASYRHQTDTLQGSLVQSVYTAGFQNGVLDDNNPNSQTPVNGNQAEQSFGWYYGAAPFEQLVTPGIRSTFALVTVPRKLISRTADKFGNADACVAFHIDAGWANRTDPMAQDAHFSLLGKTAKYGAWLVYHTTREKLVEPEGKNERVAGPESDPPYDASVLTMQTSLKLPATLEDYSLIASREKKMHVLRMEYNTVYEKPDAGAGATVVQTTVQTSTQSTNAATGQTTGQTTSQTTGTAVAVGNGSSAGGSASSSSGLNPLPCVEGKCAAILLKLDRPIDPNLVVTVRGAPLMRVRDWRGRATSVLPPAQSGTDLAASSTATGSITLNQLRTTRSLLESDQFGPNTWFALNSHELLLNISVDVATDEEFPVIQLADPSGSVVIPHDLRSSFTELIMENFRLRPQTEESIQREVGRQNWREGSDDVTDQGYCPNAGIPPGCIVSGGRPDAPISSGPYAFSTYLPLFSPDPAARSFFAMIGETGNDVLIGFLPRQDKTSRFDWMSTQTRVILEDRDQDFAWSLSCDVQGDLLSCRLPREEISRAYLNFLRACPDETACPGLEPEWQSLLRSVDNALPTSLRTVRQQQQQLQDQLQLEQLKLQRPQNLVQQGSSTAQQEALIQQVQGQLQNLQPKLQERLQQQQQVLRRDDDLKGFERAFISTMQLWIQQSDPEGKNVFYSPEPVRIAFLPLSNDFWNSAPFKPWRFEMADADSVTLEECNYWPDEDQDNVKVSVLGVPSWPVWAANRASGGNAAKPPKKNSFWVPVTNDPDVAQCGTVTLPTAALANNPVLMTMEFPPHPEKGANVAKNGAPLRTTVALPKFRIGPSYRQPEIRIRPAIEKTKANGAMPAAENKVWKIQIPIEHSTCADDIELPLDMLRPNPPQVKINGKLEDGPQDFTKIDVQWLDGASELTQCPERMGADQDSPEFRDWKTADDAGRVNLYLEIPKTAINDLPERVDIVRTTSDGVKWVVGTLPNLRRLLLPSRLTLESMSATQFALRGENAEAIDAIAMQSSDNSARTFRTAPGVDFALVTLPAASASSSGADASAAGNSSTNSMQITIDATKDNTGHVTMLTNNSSQPKAAATNKNTPEASSTDDKSDATKSLAPGSYAVVPMIQVGTTPPDPTKLKAKAAAEAELKAAEAEVAKVGPPTKAAPAKPVAPTKPTSPAGPSATARPPVAASPTAPTPPAGPSTTVTPPATAPPTTPAPSPKDPKQVAADRLANAKTALAKATAAAEPTPNYMPLRVTDERGKPLIFTIADPKKQSAATPQTAAPASTTTACAAPCVVAPCSVSCPQPPSQAAAPKSP